jgi:Asp/Glu/hydantoin racemase
VVRYLVKKPFVAVCRRTKAAFISIGDSFSFVTVDARSTIVIHGLVQRSGLVDIVVDGVVVTAFMDDIEKHTELIQVVAANRAGFN